MKRFLLGILAGLIIAGVTGVVLMFAAIRFSKREPEAPKVAWLSLRLEGDLPEAPPMAAPFPGLEDRTPLTVAEVWSTLRRAARDPNIKGVMLKPRGLAAGWGKLDEIRQGIAAVRKAGKPVYAWLATPGMREYYVAAGADRIFLSPEDLMDMKGMRIEASYFKGTLDKIGVEVEVEHVGKYKDAGDTFSRTSMTPETREALNSILDDLFPRLCDAIGRGRKMKPEQVRAMLDDGPFLAPKAKENGLIDELLYEGDADEKLAKKSQVEVGQSISARAYIQTSGGRQKKARDIAYLVASGDILRGSAANVFGEDRSINPHGITRQLNLIASDPGIRGVILRVDSPGGDAIASDEILAELKKFAKKKPLVISMGDVAASGGYYIAMTGDPIIAYPGTLTGSIGVIYGKVNLKGLYDKIGMSKEILKRGRFADIDSDYQKLTPEGRAKLRESLQFIYDGFLQRVAAGRRKTPAEIDPLAQGRVWLGSQAKERNLVDELGGLDRALEVLRKQASLSEDEPVRLVVFPARKSLWEQLLNRSGADASAGAESEASILLRQLPAGVAPWLTGGVLRVMPYRLEFR
ncbi:MAG: signal peptide peptidase SppA [Bryobacterales bacterium]|nr:signal peptide peptidase SppA [Bryobacterales bacterium]